MSRVSWDLEYKRATSITDVSYLETIFMSGRRFCPSFHVESFLRSIVQKSHINQRSELSGDHFHEWTMYSSKFSCREFLEIYSTKEPHHSQKWVIWRTFSWVGDDFVQVFMSRVSWDLLYKRAASITEVSYLETIFMSGRWFRPNIHVESFLRSIVQKATSITEVSYLETIFVSGRWFRPKFHVESFLRSKVQKSHINHRCELSGDHFHEWAMISSKFSCRKFLEIYSTKEPHQSQKWAIWRPFWWVGDEFVQFFMSKFSWDL